MYLKPVYLKRRFGSAPLGAPRIVSTHSTRPCGAGYLTSLVAKTSYNRRGPGRFHLRGGSRQAVAGSFGLDDPGSLTSKEGSGMFRPEVVLSWKAGLIHIFRSLSRISVAGNCPGWHFGFFVCSGGERPRVIHEHPALIFVLETTCRRPVWGFSS